MSEKAWRNIFIIVTVVSFLVLGALTVDSLRQVASARTPQLTDQVVAGKQTWQSKNCNDCHTILGIGGYFAPDMTKVADQRDAQWLRRWLKNPRDINPATTMPDQHLNDTQVENLIAFLQWTSKIDTNNWPPKPMMALGGGGQGPSGALLFQQKGCSSCHMINGQGAKGPGPDLSRIGTQRPAAFLGKWLENPQTVKPGTAMPRIPLTGPELDALVEYLAGLK